MQDLYLGLALMALLSVAAFALGFGLAGGHHWRGNGLAIATVLTTILYIYFIWDDIRLVLLLPVSNLVIVGNWLPLMSTFLSGVVWRRISHWRRVFGVIALWVAGGYAASAPLLADTPVCREKQDHIAKLNLTICLQSTPATCTPACAATLLNYHDIPATEAEMARLCLCGPKGTNWAGLYHGLKVKTQGTKWDVLVLTDSLKSLRRPAIISVGIPDDAKPDSFYRTEWAWNPGEEHSVILFGRMANGDVTIVDPNLLSKPRYETWPANDLDVLWRGQGMSLVPRKPTQ